MLQPQGNPTPSMRWNDRGQTWAVKGAGAAMCDSVYLKFGPGSLILESHIAALAPFTAFQKLTLTVPNVSLGRFKVKAAASRRLATALPKPAPFPPPLSLRQVEIYFGISPFSSLRSWGSDFHG